MATTLTILGCGSSAGVPSIGNHWGACNPSEPRNIRTRPSVAIQSDTTLVIVDAGPDFQLQMNRANLGTPDAILITHAHSDHINGLDELRMLQRLTKRRFPLYAFPETMENLRHRLDYMFVTSENGFYPAVCDAMTVQPGDEITIGDISIRTYAQIHGDVTCMGIRVGDTAYSTDVKTLPDEAFVALAGIRTWVVDAAGYHSRSNPVHACIEEVVEMNARVGAQKVVLTHMPPTMDYMTVARELPPGMEPAYDGLALSVT